MDKPISHPGSASFTASARLGGEVSTQIASRLWFQWLQIAMENELAAFTARVAEVTVGAGGAGFNEAITAEFHASMVAITGAASAIDGLYGEVSPLVSVALATRQHWKTSGLARHKQIFETLKVGCSLGSRTNDWPPRFSTLYRLRDPATHHKVLPRPTVPHPNGLVETGQEVADYSLENVRMAVDLACDVIETVIKRPKVPSLVTWAPDMKPMLDFIEKWRTTRPSGPR